MASPLSTGGPGALFSGDPLEPVLELFARYGDSGYGGEAVTQLEHALQTATLAAAAGSPDSLVAAALLHDLGHLLHELPDDAPDKGIDDRHELLAARKLTALLARPCAIQCGSTWRQSDISPQSSRRISRSSALPRGRASPSKGVRCRPTRWPPSSASRTGATPCNCVAGTTRRRWPDSRPRPWRPLPTSSGGASATRWPDDLAE